MTPRTALRAGQLVLLVVVTVLLPWTVKTSDAYLAVSVPCVVAFAVLCYLDGRTGRH